MHILCNIQGLIVVETTIAVATAAYLYFPVPPGHSIFLFMGIHPFENVLASASLPIICLQLRIEIAWRLPFLI